MKISIMGYNRKEVDEKLKEERKEYERVLRSQKERIFALREENQRLLMELESYKIREGAVSSVLIDAKNCAKGIIEEGRKQAVKEHERLKVELEAVTVAVHRARRVLHDVADSAVNTVQNMREDIINTTKRLDDGGKLDRMYAQAPLKESAETENGGKL